ncbi:glycosyltransferase [Mycetocola sp. JXN-3]|uniref:glycosyltransferase n=1 Tax=Mycetocola sp. JXN-3 TaxID=2116510 RepID=UPI002102B7F0|nr:glycosyltransferase family 2 protein [Mycetocola sp. JXN-3]
MSHDSVEVLPDLLRSLHTASVHPASIVVAENGTELRERTRAICAEYHAEYVELESNSGYGGGIMGALEHSPSDSEFILVTNPDVVYQPGSLDALVAAADRLPQAAVFGPRILDGNGDTYPSARRFPSLSTGIGHTLLANIMPNNRWSSRYRADVLDPEIERATEWLSGASFLIRRSVFTRVGGFDLSYFMYFEDVDLGRRVARDGQLSWYVPAAVVTHTGAHSTRGSSAQMRIEHHRSAYRFLAGQYPHWYQAPIRWSLKLGLGAHARWDARAIRRAERQDPTER